MSCSVDQLDSEEFEQFVRTYCSNFTISRFEKNPEDMWVKIDAQRVWDEKYRGNQQEFF